MKKTMTLAALALAFVLAFAGAASANVGINEKFGLPIVVYGGDLSADEKAQVAESLDVAGEAEVEEIEVTGQDLVTYITDGDARARMYSSAKITRTEEGEGLVIEIATPDNITQVTTDMYANAMLTAGIENATVEVAAPKAVTGHSALVGIYKAYEVNGEQLDPERTDVANDELSVATELSEGGVDQEKVSELLTEIKKQIAEQNPATREDVEQIVEEQLSRLQIELSPEDRQLLVDLMDRIRQLDIDFSKWSTELEDLSNTIGDKIGTVVNDEGFWESVKQFFRDLANTVRGWFN
ncbi:MULTISPECIES: DUF1002 domain-containing protein [unclassified Planococcus (in: firmicutes)]|uniref:DUF1002 domain-containing protein n=1 Tax=unclassified Planococcus (in: firmicutes) TaxID=2662419 RepID=UPI000C339139|nr:MULTISPECIES: DUF1002 domain-containing protein [unclassified Planococcus (in: firmicutes)]AUD12944.1 DUF1002 domain-containing protein [Planococcus sp. MB-3u-03]PKG47567.1 DUF1002 domain-containing protein [Planococcus sp. Urea-trap-24]PKG88110.1 DUF1002 domain-containing protein [Planococcus sp. Urea-3u-39]PKH36966.1 DUF1002 domain-containing protein [Planococcus sp. MB-3u-09]